MQSYVKSWIETVLFEGFFLTKRLKSIIAKHNWIETLIVMVAVVCFARAGVEWEWRIMLNKQFRRLWIPTDDHRCIIWCAREQYTARALQRRRERGWCEEDQGPEASGGSLSLSFAPRAAAIRRSVGCECGKCGYHKVLDNKCGKCGKCWYQVKTQSVR